MSRTSQLEVNDDPARRDPRHPTWSLPGSEGKVEVLRRRIEAGLPLWHPQDRRDYSQGWPSRTDPAL